MGCFKPNFIISRNLSQKEFDDKCCYPSSDEEREEFKQLQAAGIQMKFAKDKKVLYCYQNRDSLKTKDFFKDWRYKFFDLTPIPCGNCLGCRLDYSRSWATRCLLEAEQFKDNYFITLTYDDDHLPKGQIGNATLVPDDMTKFMKDIREYYRTHFKHTDIRFFGCGEYGDTSFRPHYHLLMFNLPIPDITPEFRYIDPVTKKEVVTKHVGPKGEIYYYSDLIHDLWKKGNVVIGAVAFDSCAYVARYVVKKLKGKSSEAYNKLCVEPPFVRMSRRPGLAYKYFFENKENIYQYDSIILATADGARIVTPPRYFNTMYEIENELRYYEIKEARKQAGNDYLNSLYENTTLHYSDYLEALENEKELQLHACKRIL